MSTGAVDWSEQFETVVPSGTGIVVFSEQFETVVPAGTGPRDVGEAYEAIPAAGMGPIDRSEVYSEPIPGSGTGPVVFGEAFNEAEYNLFNDINFGQILGVNQEHGVIFSQNIPFGSVLDYDAVFNRSLTNGLVFHQHARYNVIARSLTSNLTFGQIVGLRFELNRYVSHWFSLEQTARRTFTESLTSALSFANEVARGELVITNIVFGESVVFEKSHTASNTLVFGQILGLNFELQRALTPDPALLFQQRLSVLNVKFCTVVGLPVGSFIELSASGAITLVMRNPEYGNSEETQPRRVFKRSRGGRLLIARATIWPKDTNINFKCTALSQAKAAEVLVFIQDSLGKLITLDDQDNRIWTGILEHPEDIVVRQLGDCNYEAEFNLSMVPS